MDIILHIGLEKTATSSTQTWFAEHREALAARGVSYSRVLGEVSHRRLCLWALDQDRDDQGFLYNGIRSAEDRARFRDRLAREFAAEAAAARAAGSKVLVISNEHVSSRLHSVREVARVRDFLSPHADRIELICSVRPQVDMAVSHASTISRDRWRLTMAYFDGVTPDNPYYDFNAILTRWAGVFGRDRLTLLSYHDCPTAAHHLIGRLGLAAAGLAPVPRLNEALDIRTMAMVNALRAPLFDKDGQHNPFAQLFLGRLPVTERLSLGSVAARAIQARFEASNAALLAQFPELPARALTPDWSAYEKPANTYLLTADCAFSGQMAALVRVFNEELVLERLWTQVARVERALARGNRATAALLLDRGLASSEAVRMARHLGPAAQDALRQFKALKDRVLGSGGAAPRR